jgi:hypothetical protein
MVVLAGRVAPPVQVVLQGMSRQVQQERQEWQE